MKPKYLVHGSYARCITDPKEVERLLSQGYLLAAPKPRTKDAKRMRSLRARRQADAWLSLKLWLSPEQVAAVRAIKRPKETYAELFIRLVRERGLL